MRLRRARSVGTACSARCLKTARLRLLLPAAGGGAIYYGTGHVYGQRDGYRHSNGTRVGRRCAPRAARAAGKAAAGRCLRGAAWRRPFTITACSEPLYARMLMSGARSGNLDQVLARLAQVFSEDANMRMGRIIDSVEPVRLRISHRFGGDYSSGRDAAVDPAFSLPSDKGARG